MDANTFDLSDLFSGNSLPVEEVTVFVDEQANYELAKLEEAVAKDPSNKDLEKKRQEAVERAFAAQFIVRVGAVPRGDLMNAIKELDREHPVEYTGIGRPKPNPEREEAAEDLMWSLHLKEIQAPNGAVISEFTPEDIQALRNETPTAVAKAIDKAIAGLSSLSDKGFETAVMETDFLSKR